MKKTEGFRTFVHGPAWIEDPTILQWAMDSLGKTVMHWTDSSGDAGCEVVYKVDEICTLELPGVPALAHDWAESHGIKTRRWRKNKMFGWEMQRKSTMFQITRMLKYISMDGAVVIIWDEKDEFCKTIMGMAEYWFIPVLPFRYTGEQK